MVLSAAPFSFADLTWGGTYGSERETEKREDEKVGWSGGEKKEKRGETV